MEVRKEKLCILCITHFDSFQSALQGHEKNSKQLIDTFGEQKVIEWRRSFHGTPPSIYDHEFLEKMGPNSLETSTSSMDPRYLNVNDYLKAEEALCKKYNLEWKVYNSLLEQMNYTNQFPGSESLKQCQERAYGYWKHVIAPRVKSGERVLIVAHANTIRALVKAVDDIDDDSITHLRIPNGIPLVYHLDDNLKPVDDLSDDIGFQANYLVSAKNHSRVRF
jgi:bisphosphoglycerate-dependent phosphoglycerate mutase